ncbi:hypothetical protein CA13_61060 [Planctomycetes bacterium CA13]|uniref:Uncharacterized protein n=1 Tax=Novipirellula herctigrandis TaxID=2527986 RepID=A0A5C5ZBW8_9BACT|nr:hypothetical protein CA13_61060 [Planctomycetes bacterium CA13]
MNVTSEGLQIAPQKPDAKQIPFITRNGMSLVGPISVSMVVKTASSGAIGFAWRNSADTLFAVENRVNFSVEKSDQWQTIRASLYSESKIIHVRVHFPSGITSIKSIELKSANGKTVTLTD